MLNAEVLLESIGFRVSHWQVADGYNSLWKAKKAAVKAYVKDKCLGVSIKHLRDNSGYMVLFWNKKQVD